MNAKRLDVLKKICDADVSVSYLTARWLGAGFNCFLPLCRP